MSYHCLGEFLELLDQSGELVRVEVPVDPALEAAEITARVAGRGGPALLFGNVRGHEIPVLSNLLGTEQRFCRALGHQTLDDVAGRLADLIEPSDREGWFERLQAGSARSAWRKYVPKTVNSGPCQQMIRLGADVDLGEIPALGCCPEERHRLVTAGRLFATEADTGRTVVGRQEVAILDRNRLAVCWCAHDEAARLLAAYRQRSRTMPLAVVLGGDPAGLLAAMAPLAPGADACAVAGWLRGQPEALVRARTVDLSVPVDAEIVIEGFVDPSEPPLDAGPIATFGGCHRIASTAPVVHVTAVTHRANPIYPTLVSGTKSDELCVVRRALAGVFLPMVRREIPDLVDYDFPLFGAARHWAFVSVRKAYAGQARRVAHALWGLDQTMFSKLLVLVDDTIDVRDDRQVWSAVATQVDPQADVFFHHGPPDPWDSASDPEALGCRMAIDATTKLPAEARGRPAASATKPPEVLQLVSRRWSEYGLPLENSSRAADRSQER